eukprot:364362-Chlamydomonas_euryale.AAC.33
MTKCGNAPEGGGCRAVRTGRRCADESAAHARVLQWRLHGWDGGACTGEKEHGWDGDTSLGWMAVQAWVSWRYKHGWDGDTSLGGMAVRAFVGWRYEHEWDGGTSMGGMAVQAWVGWRYKHGLDGGTSMGWMAVQAWVGWRLCASGRTWRAHGRVTWWRAVGAAAAEGARARVRAVACAEKHQRMAAKVHLSWVTRSSTPFTREKRYAPHGI